MSAGRITYSRTCEWCDAPSPTPICRKCMGHEVERVRIEVPVMVREVKPRPVKQRAERRKPEPRPEVVKAIAREKDRRAARCVWPGCGMFAIECNHRRNIRKLGLAGKTFDPATLPTLWADRLYRQRNKGALRMSAPRTAARVERLTAVRALFADGLPHTTAEMVKVCGTKQKAMIHRYRAELGIVMVTRGLWIAAGVTPPIRPEPRLTYADRVFAYVRLHPACFAHIIAKQTGIAPSHVRDALAKLAKLGEVTSARVGKNKVWTAA